MEELEMIEFRSNNSPENVIRLIQEKTQKNEINNLISNANSIGDIKIQSSFEGYNFTLYYHTKKIIFFSPPKAFYGTVFCDNKKTVIRGDFKLTKDCFLWAVGNCLCVFLAIMGSSLIKYTVTDFISCIIISLIFVSIILTSIELFSRMFVKSSYKKIISLLIEISESEG